MEVVDHLYIINIEWLICNDYKQQWERTTQREWKFFFHRFLDAIAGIFIRDIAKGSVSARDGRLAIGDQIIEVNDQSLNGFSNVQALYLLQNTSSSVRLKVRRYTDGAKYEKIKEMIGNF